MSKTLRFRASNEQYERIRNKTQAKGFSSISAYLRHSALERDIIMEERILETYTHVSKIYAFLRRKPTTDKE